MTPLKRQSVDAVYDSRETGPRYTVTTRIGIRTIEFEKPADDPFVRHAVTVCWKDVLREWLHGRPVRVTTLIGGDSDVIEAVSELDGNYRGKAGSTRRDEADAEIRAAFGGMG